jgi:Zn-dependent protease
MRDREPISWSWTLPITPWGVTVRLHLLFPCVVLGVILHVATSKSYDHTLWWQAAALAGVLLVSVAAHEMGHGIAARRLNGDVPEVVLWPFGSLTFADVPEMPRSYAWTALGGLVVSLGLTLAAGGALVVMGFAPPGNPLSSTLTPRLHNWRDGRIYTYRTNPGESEYFYYADPENPRRWSGPVKLTFAVAEDGQRYLAHSSEPVEFIRERDRGYWRLKGTSIELVQPKLGPWPTWLTRIFLVNWLLVCVNLLPALPLDGGRLFQAWLWQRGDRRQSASTVAYGGFIVALAIGVYAIAANDLLPAIVAGILYWHSHHELVQLERQSEAANSRDFDIDSEGDEQRLDGGPERPAIAPRMSWWQRFWHDRAERRRLREIARREAEEQRLDELLDKILRQGRASLTDEEIRFLTGMSSRYSANNRPTRDSHA